MKRYGYHKKKGDDDIMIGEIDQYRKQVLYLLYDWKIQNTPASSSTGGEDDDESQFLEKPTLHQHLITPEEIEESRRLAIEYCEEYTMKDAIDLPFYAICYKGASILWLRCNKYVDTRDETGNYVVSYGDYLNKECHKLLKHYEPNKFKGFRKYVHKPKPCRHRHWEDNYV